MERIAVLSSVLKSVGHDAARRTLEVEFTDGQVWQYAPIDPGVYRELVEADSVGEYFNQRIRDAARLRVRIS